MLSDAAYQRLDWDFVNLNNPDFEKQWAEYTPRDPRVKRLNPQSPWWLEIGAGTGGFFHTLATLLPENSFLAIERDRYRGKTLEKRSEKAALSNFWGVRANAIPWVLHFVPENQVSRIYVLYPCPWPKTSERKNRWYLHPFMRVLLSKLAPGGHLVWASDQQFYIEEATYSCQQKFGLNILKSGELSPHPLNMLSHFPQGRSKFEADFLKRGQPCFELIAQKP